MTSWLYTQTRTFLLVNYADDITFSVPIRSNSPDLSLGEVQNIQIWSIENRKTLNLKKTWEMVVRGTTKKPIPEPICWEEGVLKLLGMTFNELPNNWDTHFDHMISKASSRLRILRVCKLYGYPLQELTLLFDSLIMSLFSYPIEFWACAYDSKYLSQKDRFSKRAVKYGHTAKFFSITDLISQRDLELWKKVTTDNHSLNDLLPMKRTRNLRDRSHDYVLPLVSIESFKRCFIIDVFLIFFRFSIYMSYSSTCYYAIIVNSHVCLWGLVSIKTSSSSSSSSSS